MSSARPEGSLWIHLLRRPTFSLDWRGQAHLHTVGSQSWASRPRSLSFLLQQMGPLLSLHCLSQMLVQSVAILTRLSLFSAGFIPCGLRTAVSLPNSFSCNTFCSTRLYFSWTTVILCDSILYPFGSPGASSIHRNLCLPQILSTPVIILGATYGSVFVSKLILTLGGNCSRLGLGLCYFLIPFCGTRLAQSGWPLFMRWWFEWPLGGWWLQTCLLLFICCCLIAKSFLTLLRPHGQ